MLAVAAHTIPYAVGGGCLGPSAERGVNIPIGSQRRVDEIANVAAIVDQAHPRDAVGWLYATRGGTIWYQDNRSIPLERISPILKALNHSGYQDLAREIEQRRGLFVKLDRRRGTSSFTSHLPSHVIAVYCAVRHAKPNPPAELHPSQTPQRRGWRKFTSSSLGLQQLSWKLHRKRNIEDGRPFRDAVGGEVLRVIEHRVSYRHGSVCFRGRVLPGSYYAYESS